MNQELWNLTILGMKGRKKITILIFTVLLLSFAFAVVTLSVTSSMERTNREYRFDTYGEWYGAFSLAEEEAPDWLKQEESISAVGCAETYRLLKYAKVNRILFLVDTKSLGEQAEREFLAYMPNDDNRSFSQIYGVRRLKNSYIPNDVQICISTIQRMYSILKGEELDESTEEESMYEQTSADTQPVKEVVYNKK